MKLLGYIKSRGNNVDDVIDDLIVTYNAEKHKRPDMIFKDIQLTNVPVRGMSIFGILVFEYGTDSEPTKLKNIEQFIGMKPVDYEPTQEYEDIEFKATD